MMLEFCPGGAMDDIILGIIFFSENLIKINIFSTKVTKDVCAIDNKNLIFY